MNQLMQPLSGAQHSKFATQSVKYRLLHNYGTHTKEQGGIKCHTLG